MAETSGLTFSRPAEAEEESGGGRREMDAELRIMGQMVRLLEKLPPSAAFRVIAWLRSRYETEYATE